jgi:hypothetical protein
MTPNLAARLLSYVVRTIISDLQMGRETAEARLPCPGRRPEKVQ